MTSRARGLLEFSVRSLAGPDAPWSVVERVASVGVGRDLLRAWPPPFGEPCLVRVRALGGRPGWGRALVGDWFHTPAHPALRRVPAPGWDFNPGARRWSAPRAWVDAWEDCPNGAWMLTAVAPVVPARSLVRTALGFVRPCVDVTTYEVGRALEALDAWTRGQNPPNLWLRAAAAFSATNGEYALGTVALLQVAEMAVAPTAAARILCVDATINAVAQATVNAAGLVTVEAQVERLAAVLREIAETLRAELPARDVLAALVAPRSRRRT